MAAVGKPHAGNTRRQARRKKSKLTKAAERAATPAVLAVKTVPTQVGRRASQHRRNRKMKWKQKARKAALRAASGPVLQTAEDSEAGAVDVTVGRGPTCKMLEPLSLSSSQSGNNGNKVLTDDIAKLQEVVKEEHLCNPYTNVIAEAKIADQHGAQPCQTVQHDIKEEPTLMSAPTINPKTDVSAPVCASDSGQEVPLASYAVKQEAACCAFSVCGQNGATASSWQDDSQAVSGCSPPDVTEEAMTDHGDMLAAAAAHSSGTASQSMTVQDEAGGVQGTLTQTQGTLPAPPTTASESGANPPSVKEVASHVGPADCPSQHGTVAVPSAAEPAVQLPQTKASPRKDSSAVSTGSLSAVFASLPPVTDLSFGHDF